MSKGLGLGLGLGSALGLRAKSDRISSWTWGEAMMHAEDQLEGLAPPVRFSIAPTSRFRTASFSSSDSRAASISGSGSTRKATSLSSSSATAMSRSVNLLDIVTPFRASQKWAP